MAASLILWLKFVGKELALPTEKKAKQAALPTADGPIHADKHRLHRPQLGPCAEIAV
jgi:hypothetical protein